ncbi:enolase C-terminal domain-like protein, partial [Streptomyces pakalii]
DAAPALRIAVDAHWAYRPAQARKLAAALADRDCWFLEAPLVPEDLDGHRRLAERSPVPLAVGETLRNRYEFAHWLRAGALEIAQPDVARTGITEAMTIAEISGAHHIPVAPHHSVGLGVALAAGLHVSAAVEDLLVFEYQPTSTDVGGRILRAPLAVAPDHFPLPHGPGLGIDVDEEAVRHLAEKD